MIRLFISYRTTDSEYVDPIVTRLRSLQNEQDEAIYHVWQDKDSIPAGQDWWEAICEGIIACDIFIFMVSKDSIRSAACLAELSFAHKLNAAIIPFVIEGQGKYDDTRGKYDIDFWEDIPSELNDSRIQFLFQEGVTFVNRLHKGISRIVKNPLPRLPADAPPDPRHASDATNDVTVIYADAYDFAFRGEFETAKRLLQKLINRRDPIFGEISFQWVHILDEYERIRRMVSHDSTRELGRSRWINYDAQFPKDFLPHFDPFNVAAHFAPQDEAEFISVDIAEDDGEDYVQDDNYIETDNIEDEQVEMLVDSAYESEEAHFIDDDLLETDELDDEWVELPIDEAYESEDDSLEVDELDDEQDELALDAAYESEEGHFIDDVSEDEQDELALDAEYESEEAHLVEDISKDDLLETDGDDELPDEYGAVESEIKEPIVEVGDLSDEHEVEIRDIPDSELVVSERNIAEVRGITEQKSLSESLHAPPLFKPHWKLIFSSALACAVGFGLSFMIVFRIIVPNMDPQQNNDLVTNIVSLIFLFGLPWFLQGLATAWYLGDYAENTAPHNFWWFIRSAIMGGPLNFLLVKRISSKRRWSNFPIIFAGWLVIFFVVVFATQLLEYYVFERFDAYRLYFGFLRGGMSLAPDILKRDIPTFVYSNEYLMWGAATIWAYMGIQTGSISAYITGIVINRTLQTKSQEA